MFAAITIAALIAAAPVSAVMQWSLHATPSGSVGFETRYRAVPSYGNTDSSQDSFDYPQADLESTFRGLTHAQLFGPETDVRFTVTRQEGTIVCTGRAGGGKAEGAFTFTLDPNFTSQLQTRGVGTVSPERQMEWLLDDADAIGLLDNFKSQGFPVPSVELLSTAFDHGVTLRYIREMAAVGLHAVTVEQLIRAVDHGVRPRAAAEFESYGFTNLTIDQMISLTDHGVTPVYVGGLVKLGYRVTPDQAKDLVDHGVTLRYVEKLRADGYANLSVADLVRLADHGVH
jgi:hypothetical protein